ncbi:MAG: DUF4292 domain-containing protein [Bacteroidia bacterium]|nr:DUF4292 domain-containing protein [Bacteroidia bacterium]MDW8088348.1 DUF4292 domain-containing protein [Bacteroidia bacterium]
MAPPALRYSLVGLLLLTACARRARVRTKPPNPAEITLPYLLERLRWQSPSAVLKLSYRAVYKNGREQHFFLRLLVQGDSLLWASASVFGFEGLRLLWRRDSVFLLNRLEQAAYIGPVDSLRHFLPALGVQDLVALLFAKLPPRLETAEWRWNAARQALWGRLAAYRAEGEVLWPQATAFRRWTLNLPNQPPLNLLYDWDGGRPNLPALRFEFADESALILYPQALELNPSNPAMPFQIPEGYTVRSLAQFRL